jgi:hypothetical protein
MQVVKSLTMLIVFLVASASSLTLADMNNHLLEGAAAPAPAVAVAEGAGPTKGTKTGFPDQDPTRDPMATCSLFKSSNIESDSRCTTMACVRVAMPKKENDPFSVGIVLKKSSPHPEKNEVLEEFNMLKKSVPYCLLLLCCICIGFLQPQTMTINNDDDNNQIKSTIPTKYTKTKRLHSSEGLYLLGYLVLLSMICPLVRANTCGDKTGKSGGPVTCNSFQVPAEAETECGGCVDNGSECCLDKTCAQPGGIHSNNIISPVTCGDGFIWKAGATPCSDCSDDGAECCTPRTCATGGVDPSNPFATPSNGEVFPVTCSSYYSEKPGSTLCTNCIDNGIECCAPQTCKDKTGTGGGAVTCSSAFVPKTNTCTGAEEDEQPNYCLDFNSDSASCTTMPRVAQTCEGGGDCSGTVSLGAVPCVFTPGSKETDPICTANNVQADDNYCTSYNSNEIECTVQPRTDRNGETCVFDGLLCSACSNDGSECCTLTQNCEYTWSPWSTCQPSATHVLVPGDCNNIENEQQCIDDACQGAPPGTPCSSAWIAPTSSSPAGGCEIWTGAMQERSPSITIHPQGGGTECPDPEDRYCKLDVSVYSFFV